MSCLNPEAAARINIDHQLDGCVRVVQDYKHASVVADPGVAVREGTTLAGVESETRRYETSCAGTLSASSSMRPLAPGR